ncbi:hypothetical protein KIN20_011804 [Parelaphostrongylus tenuis]|uniref:Uncharacterized protein n=1 Tax=Parelaphostrongylus tenuis TaxID=148309 RepID=A0AAD5MBC5_PARTN|nr:hypothetical protein KIN20_011804 [Parelaphostrongylus tenuis]
MNQSTAHFMEDDFRSQLIGYDMKTPPASASRAVNTTHCSVVSDTNYREKIVGRPRTIPSARRTYWAALVRDREKWKCCWYSLESLDDQRDDRSIFNELLHVAPLSFTLTCGKQEKQP